MKIIYNLLIAHLRAMVPTIKYMDLFNNNFKQIENQYPFDFPAIFIEFGTIPFETMGEGWQQGEAVIRVHVAQRSFKDTQEGAYATNGYDPLDILDFIDSVHAALQGFVAKAAINTINHDICSPLQRISFDQDTDHTNLFVYVMGYSTSILDANAAAGKNNVNTSAGLKITYSHPVVRP